MERKVSLVGKKEYRNHNVTIKTPEGKLVLKPGPVYCFYSQAHFKRTETAPSFKSFRKKIRVADIESVVLHGKPLVDPYYLNWRYVCRIRYDHVMRNIRSRSLKTSEAKALNNLMRKHQAVLDRLKGALRNSERNPRQQAVAKAISQLERTRAAQQEESLTLKKRWDSKCLAQAKKNRPYLSLFTPQQQREYCYFQTEDLKRLWAAKTRALESRDAWKDFYFQMRSPIIRALTPWNLTLANAMRRNKRWLRRTPDLDLISRHFSKTKRAVDNFKVGFLGQKKQNLISPNRTIGYNLIKILMVANVCGENEARKKALALLADLDVYDPADAMTRRIWQFINDDYHYKILLAYLLAFAPETLVVDRSALNTGHGLTAELYALIIKLQPKYGYTFVIYDDTMFDKDFDNMVVYVVTDDKRIVTESEFKARQVLPHSTR